MRAALNALTDELKRLKTSGVKSIVVTDATLASLKKAVLARADQHENLNPPKPTPEVISPPPADAPRSLEPVAPLQPVAKRQEPSSNQRARR